MTKASEMVTRQSTDILAERMGELKAIFPDVFTEGKVDWEKLRAALGEQVDDRPERYSFSWAGKREAIRLLQTPSSATLGPAVEESVNWEGTQHLFIEGDNLEVLKLLYKPYFGRVKMIYIDPPYNTGGDFIYPDNYTDPLETYLRLTGQKDTAGNILTSNMETSGRYHSAWLSMMHPRLFVSRQLLREDGVIFVSIDDNEVHNLRMLMNEVFGEENFVATIIWEKKYSPQNDARWLSDNHDYVLLYARNKEIWRPKLLPRTEEANARFINPDHDPRGPWKSSDFSVRTYSAAYDYPVTTPSGRVVTPPQGRCWVVSKKRFEELVSDNRIWFGPNGDGVPAIKRFLSEVKQGMTSLTIWKRDEVGDTQEARKTIREFFGDTQTFDTPKSVGLIKKMLLLSTESRENDIVLDFFAGSSTTAQAVLELNREDGGNRRFMMIQLPEPTPHTPFPTLADISKERIRQVIKKLQRKSEKQFDTFSQLIPEDLGFRVFKLAKSNFRPWAGVEAPDSNAYIQQMSLFTDPLIDGWQAEDVIFEIALKEGFGLNTNCEILDLPGQTIYRVKAYDTEQTLLLCLDSQVSANISELLKLTQNDLFICRDIALDDTAAANLALQCRLRII